MRRTVTFIKIILLSLLFGLLLLVAFHNRQPVSVSLHPLPYEAEMPLFLLAILLFTAGVLCCGAMLHIKHFGLRRDHSRMRKRADALENELAGFRHASRSNLPKP